MFSEETAASIPAWIARKQAQWALAVASGVAGLQLVRSGEQRTAFMMIRSTDDFYEGVIIGQLPQIETRIDSRGTVYEVPNAAKKRDNREIDLSDAQVQSIIDLWSENKSALTLACVSSVFLQNGSEQKRR